MGGTTRSADGRVLRGRRNKDSVVEAFLSLIEEGDARPTARSIAARAGLSTRSVFQHFSDLEEIYEAAGRRQVRKMARLFEPIDPTVPLDARIAAFVSRRSETLELLDPVARAARLREPFSTQLQANRAKVVALMRDQCHATFAPELAAAVHDDVGAADLLIALATAGSWAGWYHLRNDQGLDPEQAARVVTVMMSTLLGADATPLPEMSARR